MKKIVKKSVASLLKKTAFRTSASACMGAMYQPLEPKCLKK
ncbi:cyclic lactone autoinducer peptide [Clostridium oceanicum]|uniref:Cyclic lactone autoinducer peptide n=1 Tax=Clostridium oceanicum TaxID=1543 RepID=A0ABP3V363_9CLOT